MLEDSLIGETVAGRYKVLRKMGEGGMGVVYLAEHVAIEKKLALKVLLLEYARKADLKERFLREAKAAAAIGHENIVDITDFGETPDGSVFFAMEYLEGHDLSYHIKQSGPIPWSRAKPIVLQICRALGAAHAKSIVHRDMKPENIFLIEREGRPEFVKVLDFGIAKVSGAKDGEHRLTRTGMIFGTPEYMSPEQAQGHSPDHRVDIYALGVIMYELLTGQVPFKADTFMGILTKHLFEQPMPPSRCVPSLQIPADVEAIVLKALAKDRNDRFQSMSEMGAAIAQASGRIAHASSDMLAPPRVLATARGSDARLVAADTMAPPVSARRSSASVRPTDGLPALPTNHGKLLAMALGLVLLLGAAIAGFVLLRGGTEEEALPTAGASRQDAGKTMRTVAAVPDAGGTRTVPRVTIQIASDPMGAKVYKGTRLIGITPTQLSVDKSDRRVMLSFTLAGYYDLHEAIVPDREGKQLQVRLRRRPTAPVEPPPPERRAAHKAHRVHRRRVTRTTATSKPPITEVPRQPTDETSPKKREHRGPRRVEDLMNPF